MSALDQSYERALASAGAWKRRKWDSLPVGTKFRFEERWTSGPFVGIKVKTSSSGFLDEGQSDPMGFREQTLNAPAKTYVIALLDPNLKARKAKGRLPHQIFMLYEEIAALDARGLLPGDLHAKRPNYFGFLCRVPGQLHYRKPPAGSPDEQSNGPSQRELELFETELKIALGRAK